MYELPVHSRKRVVKQVKIGFHLFFVKEKLNPVQFFWVAFAHRSAHYLGIKSQPLHCEVPIPMKLITHQQWAYVTLRFTLGINMFMHGFARILSGVGAFADKMTAGFGESPLPAPLVRAFLMGLPFVELIIGLLMLLGLFTRYALIAGAFLITLLTFGSTSKQDWATASVQLPYAIAFFILLFTLEHNRLRIRD